MSENATEFDSEQHRKKWLRRLADESEKVEKLLPANFLPKSSEYPKWVENIERELSLILLPAAKLRDANHVITPRRMGAVIGHGCAMSVRLIEWFGSNEHEAAGNEAEPISNEELKAAEELHRGFVIWYNAARRLAKLSLCSCVDQSYGDSGDGPATADGLQAGLFDDPSIPF